MQYFLHMLTRCGRVVTDFLPYPKFREKLTKLIKNPKRFCDVSNMTNVHCRAGPQKLSKLRFSKMLIKNLDQKFKFGSKK